MAAVLPGTCCCLTPLRRTVGPDSTALLENSSTDTPRRDDHPSRRGRAVGGRPLAGPSPILSTGLAKRVDVLAARVSLVERGRALRPPMTTGGLLHEGRRHSRNQPHETAQLTPYGRLRQQIVE